MNIGTKITTHNLQETAAFAAQFVRDISALGRENGATVIGLEGDLGSGKTAFTQCVAQELGVEEHVTSPTFVIEKVYKVSNQNFSHLIHIDAYRLEKGEELARLGWKDLIKDPKNLILIEWPGNVAEIIPEHAYLLRFTFIDDTTREIELVK